MLIKCDIHMVEKSCEAALAYIKVEQDKQFEKEVKRKMSGLFSYTKREDAEESIRKDRWFVPKFHFAEAKLRDMLDSIRLVQKTMGSAMPNYVKLTDEEASHIYKWRNICKL